MGRREKRAKPLLKLDLGCGQSKREGFTGVDVVRISGVDVVHNLLAFPWPFGDESVEEVHCSHFFEHVPGRQRPAFMDELHRVMVVGGRAMFITPDSGSDRAVQDFTHEWPPVCPGSFLYFNRKWREDNRLSHYPIKRADFDFSYGYTIAPHYLGRSQEFLQGATQTMRNVAMDLTVTLTKR